MESWEEMLDEWEHESWEFRDAQLKDLEAQVVKAGKDLDELCRQGQLALEKRNTDTSAQLLAGRVKDGRQAFRLLVVEFKELVQGEEKIADSPAMSLEDWKAFRAYVVRKLDRAVEISRGLEKAYPDAGISPASSVASLHLVPAASVEKARVVEQPEGATGGARPKTTGPIAPQQVHHTRSKGPEGLNSDWVDDVEKSFRQRKGENYGPRSWRNSRSKSQADLRNVNPQTRVFNLNQDEFILTGGGPTPEGPQQPSGLPPEPGEPVPEQHEPSSSQSFRQDHFAQSTGQWNQGRQSRFDTRRPTSQISERQRRMIASLQSPWNILPSVEDQELRTDPLKMISTQTQLKFDGSSPAAFYKWRANFMRVAHRNNASVDTKLQCMAVCLIGKAARELVEGDDPYLAYAATIANLETNYGGVENLMDHFEEKLEAMKFIPDYDLEKWQELYRTLQSFEVVLSEPALEHHKSSRHVMKMAMRLVSESAFSRYKSWLRADASRVKSTTTFLQWIGKVELPDIRDHAHSQAGNQFRQKAKAPKAKAESAFFGEQRKPFHKGKDRGPRKKEKCPFDEQMHYIIDCPQFKSWSPSERKSRTVLVKRCLLCLNEGHIAADCPSQRRCKECGQKHHTLLHGYDPKHAAFKEKFEKFKSVAAHYAYHGHESEASDTESGGESATEEEIDDEVLSSLTEGFSLHGAAPGLISLRFAPVWVQNPITKKSMYVNALLDDGTSYSGVSDELSEFLGLTGIPCKFRMHTMGGDAKDYNTMQVVVKVKSHDKTFSRLLECKSIPTPTGNLQPIDWNLAKTHWDYLKDIQFPELSGRPCIDIVIGNDAPEIMSSKEEVGPEDEEGGKPIARRTVLGWTCCGPSHPGEAEAIEAHFAFHARGRHEFLGLDVEKPLYSFEQKSFMGAVPAENFDAKMVEALERQWQLEQYAQVDPTLLTEKDRAALRVWEATLRKSGDIYEVGLPWKEGEPLLPNNRRYALQRHDRTMHNLKSKGGGTYDAFNAQLQEWFSMGIFRVVPPEEVNPEVAYYLPIFAVLRPDKTTTKVRPVFDAAARTKGKCINDAVLPGPNMIGDIVSILTHLRKGLYALTGDIKLMYLFIGVTLADRKFLRFFWTRPGDTQPSECEFTRHPFGLASSPGVSQFVARRNAEIHEKQAPKALEVIRSQMLMDDCFASSDDEVELLEIHRQLVWVWQQAGMCMRKCATNSRLVLDSLREEDRAQSIEFDCAEAELFPVVKTLGLIWLAAEDCFTYRYQRPLQMKWNCRSLLSVFMGLYDPLGLISPFILKARILFQETWFTYKDWDAEVSDELQIQWEHWLKDCARLPEIRVPRATKKVVESEIAENDFVTFTDASTKAFGGVTYRRTVDRAGEVHVALVQAKGRVAPKNVTTIVKLELCGAMEGLTVVKRVLRVHSDHSLKRVFFFVDSQTVCAQIRKESLSFPPFVANRIGEIHNHTSPKQWQFVRGEENPADAISRGLFMEELVGNRLWFEGPEWLKLPKDQWPKTERFADTEEVRASMKVQHQQGFHASAMEEERFFYGGGFVEYVKRFSSYTTLMRAVAWLIRVLVRRKGKTPLNAEDCQRAELVLIRAAQREHLADVVKELQKSGRLSRTHRLYALKPSLDKDGVVRMNARLQATQHLSEDRRRPFLLSAEGHFAELLTRHMHVVEMKHAGGKHSLWSALSAKYWLIKGHNLCRKVCQECVKCSIRDEMCLRAEEAPLPDFRVPNEVERPGAFVFVGMDIAGPFYTKPDVAKPKVHKKKWTRKQLLKYYKAPNRELLSPPEPEIAQKRYMLLFCCMKIRAVHLELIHSMDTSEVLCGIQRFVDRRGKPAMILSDCAPSFRRADLELREAWRRVDKEALAQGCSEIQWNFIAPNTPQLGGVYERLVGVVKRALNTILPVGLLTDSQMATAFTAAEALVNSRPLSIARHDAADPEPLTPGHFLWGSGFNRLAPVSKDLWFTQEFAHIQELMHKFWRRFIAEILPALQSSKDKVGSSVALNPGDVVAIIDKRNAIGKWPLGRVIRAEPTLRDGRVRRVLLRSRGHVFVRSIRQLIRLARSEGSGEDARLVEIDQDQL